MYVDNSPVCYAIAVIIGLLTAGLVLLYIKRRQQGPYYQGPGKDMPIKVIGAFIVILIVCNSILISSTYISTHDRHLDYMLEITSDIDGVIMIPVSRYEPLESKLDVTMGDGEVKLSDTEHGRAIRVEFNGPVDVTGDLMTLWRIDDWGLTMPTTNGTYQWIYFEPSGQEGAHCNIRLSLTKRSPIGSSADLEIICRLSPGWNTYFVEEGFTVV